MITWFGDVTSSWWSDAIASITDAIDDFDRAWDPFLTDDHLPMDQFHPAG